MACLTHGPVLVLQVGLCWLQPLVSAVAKAMQAAADDKDEDVSDSAENVDPNAAGDVADGSKVKQTGRQQRGRRATPLEVPPVVTHFIDAARLKKVDAEQHFATWQQCVPVPGGGMTSQHMRCLCTDISC